MPHVKQHRSQQWQKFLPIPFVAIIAIIQMLLTFIIIGLEVWSVLINRKYSFFFIGFITSIFFTITWISTFILGKNTKLLIR
jgi:amino acid permease